MIKLTSSIKDTPIYLNPEHITQVNKSFGVGDETIVTCISHQLDSWIEVTESPEEVIQKILDYKFSLEEYRMRLASGDMYLAQGRADELLKLAGLTPEWKQKLGEEIKALMKDES